MRKPLYVVSDQDIKQTGLYNNRRWLDYRNRTTYVAKTKVLYSGQLHVQTDLCLCSLQRFKAGFLMLLLYEQLSRENLIFAYAKI